MANKTIKPDNLVSEVMGILDEYAERINVVSEDVVRRATNDARNNVRANSPESGTRSDQAYKGHWRTSIFRENGIIKGRVWNMKSGLVQLLEYGHATINGGRTLEQSHVAPAQEVGAQSLETLIKKEIAHI